MAAIAIDLQGTAAIEFIMSQAASPLSQAWDGGFERVGFVFQAGDRFEVGFMERGAMIAELGKRAEAVTQGRAEIHAMAAQLERGPLRAVQCVFCMGDAAALIEIEPEDLRAIPDRPGTGKPNVAEFALAIHEAAAYDGAREIVARLRTRTAAALGATGAPPAPGALEAVDALAAAIEGSWDDAAVVAAAVTSALFATGPLTPTAYGQHVRQLLAALSEAVHQRPPPGFVRSPGGSA